MVVPLATPAVASVQPEDPVTTGALSPEDKALRDAKASGKPVEVVKDRTELSDTWANPDGTFSHKRYGTPVRVMRNKVWVPTDPTLAFAADGSVKPKATSVAVTFSGGGTGPLLTGVKDGRTLSLSWPSALPKPTLNGNVATYAEVLPGVDVQLKAEVEGFSQLVVVKTAQAAANPQLATLKYTMSTVGVTVSTDPATGSVKATNPAGQTVFTSPAPMMWDSTTTSSQGGAQTLKSGAVQSGAKGVQGASAAQAAPVALTADQGTSPGSAFEQPAGSKDAVMPTAVSGNQLQITPDQNLLKAADTTYPVYIDPSWAWGGRMNWARVYKKYPDQPYWNANEVARVGYENQSNGLARSFFQMDTSNVAGTKVIKSTFRINNVWSWSCQDRPVQLWHTGGINDRTTWNRQPNKIDWLATVNDSKGWSGSSCPGGNLEFDLTWKMQRIAEARQNNITLGLYAENEADTFAWKKFDPKSAFLETIYNNPPKAPWGMGTNPQTDCGNGGLIGNTNVSLYATVDDPDAGNLEAWFQVSREGGGQVLEQAVPALKGQVATLAVPDALLPTGTYLWKARAKDELGEYSAWSGPCKFTVDRTRPNRSPSISSGQFPRGDNGWPAFTGQARTEGTFTIGANGVGDVVKYGYYTDSNPETKYVSVSAGSSTDVKVTPTGVGPHRVYAYSVDAAGNRSDTATYLYYATRSSDRDKEYDLNGDGFRDIWALGPDGNLLTYAGQGNGKFSSAINGGQKFATGQVTFSNDWTEDGYNDLIVLDYDNIAKRKQLTMYPNNGLGIASQKTGNESKKVLTVGCPVADPENGCAEGTDYWGAADQVLAAGDLDGDGRGDLLVKTGKLLWAYHGDSSGYLDNGPTISVAGDDWDQFTLMAPGDVNGDGVTDLWMRHNTSGDVYRAYGRKLDNGAIDTATLGAPGTRVKIGGGVDRNTYPTVGSSGDITGDGIADLWAVQSDNTLVAWPGKEPGTDNHSFGSRFLVSGSWLAPGKRLLSGEELVSTRTKVVMQADGNLALYHLDAPGNALWTSQTWNNPGATATMQTDGNLVIHATDGRPIWSSNTYNNWGAYAQLQDDGNFVVYTATGGQHVGGAIWHSATWRSGQVVQSGHTMWTGQWSETEKTVLLMQADGNLCLYRKSDKKPIWHSNTWGNPGAWLSMQADGNLVVYRAGGGGGTGALWATGTFWSPGAYFYAQNDGNLVVYKKEGSPATGNAIWSSSSFA